MNTPWKVVFAFTAVFIAGLICGGPLFAWAQKLLHDRRPPFAERTMKRFEKELNLTETQKQNIQPILLRAQNEWRQHRHENMRNLTGVIDRMHADLAATLTPEQRGRLEVIAGEFRKSAERFRGRIVNQEGHSKQHQHRK